MDGWSLLWIGVAFGLSLLFTPLVRGFARRVGMVAKPRADRWHQKPTALLGGVAFFAAALITGLVAGTITQQRAVLFLASGVLFVVGLLDDIFRIRPYQKLIGQIAGALLWIVLGGTFRWTPWWFADVAITLFWIVGITNAINLLDNMDGLSAGISSTAAIFLAICFWQNENGEWASLLAILAASLLGFLVYNHNPASIFMGDCGALFLGQFLAGASVANRVGADATSFFAVVAVPVLILFIPIFDTTLVTVLRIRAGRPISQGGRDHTSHRLVALGFSERRAVWRLYGLGGLAGSLALVAGAAPLAVSLPLTALFVIGMAGFAVRLARVKVYDAPAA